MSWWCVAAFASHVHSQQAAKSTMFHVCESFTRARTSHSSRGVCLFFQRRTQSDGFRVLPSLRPPPLTTLSLQQTDPRRPSRLPIPILATRLSGRGRRWRRDLLYPPDSRVHGPHTSRDTLDNPVQAHPRLWASQRGPASEGMGDL